MSTSPLQNALNLTPAQRERVRRVAMRADQMIKEMDARAEGQAA